LYITVIHVTNNHRKYQLCPLEHIPFIASDEAGRYAVLWSVCMSDLGEQSEKFVN